ncbi:hypothetical protein PMKS-002079 [Pichia membranifaciens]|uniref:Plectin/eS10 N-terminal domain-containing protein n=1 Tax=Pichia membranifaciens TaxID=4926 RepID=A0A1Q2YG97_9ASCO|nr:hypothetical protein PMKS-002079 [Pichia membranifaciens]
MQSLTSKGFVKTQFSWQYYYYTLTDEGLDFLREFLGVPEGIVPQTLMEQPIPQRQQNFRREGGRRFDGDNGSSPQLPHPIQQLANTYNETKRPIPPAVPKANKASKPPTIINNYYYMQAPPPNMPILQSYVDPHQSPHTDQPKQHLPPQPQPQPQPHHLHQHHNNHHQRDDSLQHQPLPRALSSQNYPAEPYDDVREYRQRPEGRRSPRRDVSNHSTASNDHVQQKFSAHHKSPSRISSAGSLTSEGTFSTHNAYDSFVKRSGKGHSSNRSSPVKKESLIDNLYQRESIYSSTSISDGSRNKLPREERDHIVARIPNVAAACHDADSLDNEISNLSLNNDRNLIKELMKLKDDEINVHSEEIFRFFDDSCLSNSSMNIEQLGSILYDPYDSNSRLSFKTLNVLINTFASKTHDEMDFRTFVKMCKFVKGCYVSFNYHDKRGNDHVLDFDEFQLALRSNRIVCSDRLLAEIFQDSEVLDFEQYLVAIILIRKIETNKH